MVGLSAGAQNLQDRLGSKLIQQMKEIAKYNWAKRDSYYKPMDWSYRQLNAIRNDVSGNVSVSDVKQVFAGEYFLKFLTQSGDVTWGTVVSALQTAVDYELARYTVRQMRYIVEGGNIDQLGKWQAAISERGIGNLAVSNTWLNKGETLDVFIDSGNETVSSVFAEAKQRVNTKVHDTWSSVSSSFNNLQLLVTSYQAFPLIGNSKDIRTILADGLDSLNQNLGDGIVAENTAKSGILDYYASLMKDIAWLKARKQTSANDFGITNINALKANVENTVINFINSQAAWMKNGLSYYNSAKSYENRERIFLIIQAVVSGVAAIGSVGFGYSNYMALKGQVDRGDAPINRPAFFGSLTLLANNGVTSILTTYRAILNTTHQGRVPELSSGIKTAIESFDAAAAELKDSIFPDMFQQMYYKGGKWNDKKADVLWEYKTSQSQAAAGHRLITENEYAAYLGQYNIEDLKKDYIAFFWTETHQGVRGVGQRYWYKGIVGIRADEFTGALSDLYKDTKHTNSLDSLYSVTGGVDDDYLSNPNIGIDGSIDGGAGDDFLEANDANNTLIGGDGDDYLMGGLGDNSLSGGSGCDNLIGGDGSETLSGGDGDDTLQSGDGYNLLDGGAGDDSIQVEGSGDNAVSGGDGDDYIDLWANTGSSSASGDAGNDNIVASQLNSSNLSGGDGNDTLYGENGADTLTGGNGDDVIYSNGEFYNKVYDNVVNNGTDGNLLDGGAGADQLFSANGNDTLLGGAGNDTIQGNGGGNLSAFGGDGDDYIDLWGNTGRSSASGDAGNDNLVASRTNASSLSGGNGNDTLNGENGADTLMGGAGNDVLYANGEYTRGVTGNILNNGKDGSGNWLDGGDGADQLFSAAGNDTLLGGAGNDTIQGRGGGNLSAFGGDGDDYIDLWGNTGRSSASGDAGNDNLVASRTAASSLSGGDGNDTLYGENGADTLTGGAGNDVLYANGEYYKKVFGNVVNNGTDANWLDGGDGNDKLYGAGGNDTIIGGGGANTLTGDAGADTFVFKPTDGGSNYIWDFNETQGDRILIAAGKAGTSSWISSTQVINGQSIAFWKLSGTAYNTNGTSAGAFDNIFVRKDGYVNALGMTNPVASPTYLPVFNSSF